MREIRTSEIVARSDANISGPPDSERIKQRTLFISDTHLGTRGFEAERLIELLKRFSFEKIIIVGDFIDIWQLKRRRFWPQRHTDIIRKMLRRSKKMPVIYVWGNHDEWVEWFGGDLGNIEICERYYHTTADGKKLLVIHGHQFDYVTKHAKWVAKLGSAAYGMLIRCNMWYNRIRKRFGHKHWSLSSYVKKRVKNAVSFIFGFEDALARYASTQEDVDGVVCGHIHTPDIKRFEEYGIDYYNCGDWVESCSALIEDFDGKIQLYEFVDEDPVVVSNLHTSSSSLTHTD